MKINIEIDNFGDLVTLVEFLANGILVDLKAVPSNYPPVEPLEVEPIDKSEPKPDRPVEMPPGVWKTRNINAPVEVPRETKITVKPEALEQRFPSATTIKADDLDTDKPAQLVEKLTEREIEVLSLLAVPMSHAQVADRLRVTLATVSAHTQNIRQKLQAENTFEAIGIASTKGWLKSVVLHEESSPRPPIKDDKEIRQCDDCGLDYRSLISSKGKYCPDCGSKRKGIATRQRFAAKKQNGGR